MKKSDIIALILPVCKDHGFKATFTSLMRKPLWELWFLFDIYTRNAGDVQANYFEIRNYWREQFAVELFPITKES